MSDESRTSGLDWCKRAVCSVLVLGGGLAAGAPLKRRLSLVFDVPEESNERIFI